GAVAAGRGRGSYYAGTPFARHRTTSPHPFMESAMAKNRKKRGPVAAAAAAVTETVTKAAKVTAKAAEEYVVEPVGKALGLTAPKKKVKRPKYERPPRA